MEPDELRSLERIFAMACLTIVVVVCLIHGVDHAIVAVIAAIIGAIVGVKVEKIRNLLGEG